MTNEVNNEGATASNKDIVTGLFTIGMFGLMVLYSSWVNAFVWTRAFRWFAHPLFPHINEPTLDQFVAAAIIWSVIKNGIPTKSNPRDARTSTRTLVDLAIYPWVYLLILWVVHQVFVPTPYVWMGQ